MHVTETATTMFYRHGDYSGAVVFEARDQETGQLREVAAPFPVLAAAALENAELPAAATIGLSVREAGGAYADPYVGETFTVSLLLGDLRTFLGRRVQYDRIRVLESMTARELYALGAANEVPKWAAGPHVWL